MNRILKTILTVAMALLLVPGCSSRDDRLTRMVEQQAEQNREMARLNRGVAEGMTQISRETAEYRNAALAIQSKLHEQRAELVRKQEALDEERRRYAQHDPLVAKAVTHVGISMACLLPLGLCWHLLLQPIDQQLEPSANDLLLQDLTSDRPVLASTTMSREEKRLPYRTVDKETQTTAA